MVNVLKFGTLFHTYLAKFLLCMQLFLQIIDGVAYNVDPDQLLLKEQSDLGLHCSC